VPHIRDEAGRWARGNLIMHAKQRTKDQIMELIARAPNGIQVYSDNQWKYPISESMINRDQGHNIMLDVMFHIERRPGIVLYLPGITLEDIESEDKKNG
jgi:hypothetical protein